MKPPITLDAETLLPIVARRPQAAPKTPPPDPKPQSKKRGRKATEFTPDQVEAVQKLAAFLSQRQIAAFLEIPLRSFERMLEKNPDVKAKFEAGKAAAIGNVAGALIQSALAGNVAAQCFFLKTQGGWRERDAGGVNPDSDTGTAQGALKITPEFEAEVKRIAERQAQLVPPLKFSQTNV